MTTGPAQGAWDRLAVALGGDGPTSGPDPSASAPLPLGWARVRDALTASAPSQAPEEQRAPESADGPRVAPAGWGQVRQALQAATASAAAVAEPAAPAPSRSAAVADVEPVADTTSSIVTPSDTAPEGSERGAAKRRSFHPLSAAARFWSSLWGKATTVVVVVVVAVAVVVAVTLALVLPGGGLPSNASLRVNGKVVTVAQFTSQLASLNGLYGVQAPQSSDSKSYDTFLRAAAHALAVNMLLDDIGAKRNLTVSQKAARDTLDQSISQQYAGNTTQFTQALTARGLNENEVVTAIAHQQMVKTLFAQVVGTVTVTQSQIQQYYASHTAQLATPERRTVNRIIVASQSTAQSIATQVQHGTSFATLASQQSLDTSTKSQGGVLGTYSASDLSGAAPAFAQAAFAAPINAIFGPVQDKNLWEVGQVTAITPPAAAVFDAKTQAAIKLILTDQAELAKWQAWLGRQITVAHITYASKYRPAHPDAPPTATLPQLTGESIADSSLSGSTGSGSTGSGSTGSSTSSP